METFLYQASIYLAAAVIAVPVATRLGLGSVLGYLAAGILIGPVLHLVGAETEKLQHFAEFGVVMMLFLIGLELDPRALWDMRHRLIGLGGLQIALTTLALTGAAMALGQDWSVALAIGLTLSLSSTAIVLQTLSEKGLMQTGGGRSAFSVLLTQDIAVIPILAFLPLLASAPTARIAADGSIQRPGTSHSDAAAHGTQSLVDGLPGWGVTLVTIGMVATIILAGVYLARPVFRFIHATRLREMYTALALVIVVGISFLMLQVGLSPALGAFLAGVVLANSEFRHELESDLEPFKGLLLGLFFITVGAGIDFPTFFDAPGDFIGMALLLTLIKALVLYVLARGAGMRPSDRRLFTLSLAQAGEFGFVLVSLSLSLYVIPAQTAQKLMLIVALSMLITPLLFITNDLLHRLLHDKGAAPEPDEIDIQGPVIIAGIGRFGQIVNRLLQGSGFQTVVLDSNMEMIQLMRRFGYKGFLGDPTRPQLLKAAGLDRASVLVAAMGDRASVTQLVRLARRHRPDLHIIARAYDRPHVYELYQAGANDIVRETFDSALRAGRYSLEQLGLNDYEASEAEHMFYEHDRRAVQELAQLWKPGVPAAQNADYVARARSLEKDLETALINRSGTEQAATQATDQDAGQDAATGSE